MKLIFFLTIKGFLYLREDKMTEFDFQGFEERAKEWLEYSAVSRNYPPSFSHNLRKSHGGIKPPELMYELLKLTLQNLKAY